VSARHSDARSHRLPPKRIGDGATACLPFCERSPFRRTIAPRAATALASRRHVAGCPRDGSGRCQGRRRDGRTAGDARDDDALVAINEEIVGSGTDPCALGEVVVVIEDYPTARSFPRWGWVRRKNPEPIPECPKIKSYLAFFNERMEEIRVDGMAAPRPLTPWSPEWRGKEASVSDPRGLVARP
jgi:hypothetical protein